MEGWRALQGPLLYAHRGARLEQPENTLPAFAAALQAGADALEIDVHMTRDRHVVVAHDPDGARTAGVARAIRDCSLAAVQGWDLTRGCGGPDARASARVPTLDETLREFPSALLNVDVKPPEPEVLGPLLRVIAQHAAEPRVLLTSFSSATTARIRALGYRGPTGMGRAEAARAVLAPGPLLRRLRPRGQRLQLPLRAGPLRLDRAALVRKAHALGVAVDYWVVDDRALAERLLALGADGIVSDDPRAMAALFACSAYTQGWRARHPALAGGAQPQPQEAGAS